MSGKLFGIGIGPGDPELLTVKAHRILTRSPVVAYPAPDNGKSFARSIVASLLKRDQIEIPIVIPMRVQRFPAREIYDRAAEELWDEELEDSHQHRSHDGNGHAPAMPERHRGDSPQDPRIDLRHLRSMTLLRRAIQRQKSLLGG